MNISRSLRALALISLLMLAAGPAIARPIFIGMNASKPGETPHDFGYEVSAKRTGGTVAFALDLNATASKAFGSAKIIFITPTPVRVTTTKDGLKHLTFAVPVEQLGRGLLEIRSGFLRDKDSQMSINFYAYRLILGSIPIDGVQPQEKSAPATPASSPKPAGAQQSIDPAKLPGELQKWMDECAKTKNPSPDLLAKINGAIGQSVVVSGFFKEEGDPMLLSVGSVDYQGGVDYIFHYDPANPRVGGLVVYGECEGIISYIDPVKKIVTLDHVALKWRGAD